MARDVSDLAPIASKHDLIEAIASGEKPKSAWRIGTEHEKIPFDRQNLKPVPYETERGIRALLEGLQAKTLWQPIEDRGRIIGLYDPEGGGAISLEPGGQFELSGAPLVSLHETAKETAKHLADANAVAASLGIVFLDLGMNPVWMTREIPVMPKQRYKIMADYMPKVGAHGLDMMFRSATVQVNLDFASEADMVKKLRVSLSLQPLAGALFANSPFLDGKPSGFRSTRSHIWLDTDRDRTGMLAFAFEDDMGYERYVDWALGVPMYFIKRGDRYRDVAGAAFKDLMAGRLQAMPGERAVQSDWVNHLSTLFPEVRLKSYLEMRGADMGPRAHIDALSAFWTGLLYDDMALDGAWDLVKEWTAEERDTMRREMPRLGLETIIAGRSLHAVAREILALAHRGLARRGVTNAQGQDETIYLSPLDEIVESGKTRADRLLERYHKKGAASLNWLFDECVL